MSDKFVLECEIATPLPVKPLPDIACELQCIDKMVRIKKVRSSYTVQCVGFLPPFVSTLSSDSGFLHASCWNIGKYHDLDTAKLVFRQCARELLNEML